VYCAFARDELAREGFMNRFAISKRIPIDVFCVCMKRFAIL